MIDGLVLQSTENDSIRTDAISIFATDLPGNLDYLPLDTVARKMAQFGVHMYSPNAR